MKKIVTLTFEDDSRESGNVYYSRSYLLESDTLKFDEPIFTATVFQVSGDSSDEQMDAALQILRGLGYVVHDDIEKVIITVTEGETRSVQGIFEQFLGAKA